MTDLTSRLTTLQNNFATYKTLHDERVEVDQVLANVAHKTLADVTDEANGLPGEERFADRHEAVGAASGEVLEGAKSYEADQTLWNNRNQILEEGRKTLYLYPEKSRSHFHKIIDGVRESDLNRTELLQTLRSLKERAREEPESGGFFSVWTTGSGGQPNEREITARTPTPKKGTRRALFGIAEDDRDSFDPRAKTLEEYTDLLDRSITRIEKTPTDEPTNPSAQPLTDALAALSEAYQSEMARMNEGRPADPGSSASIAGRWSFLKGACWVGVVGSLAGGAFVFRRWGRRMGIGLAVPGSLGSLTGAWGSTKREHLWAEDAVEGFYRNHGFEEAEAGRVLDFATFKGWLQDQSPGRAVLNAAAHLN